MTTTELFAAVALRVLMTIHYNYAAGGGPVSDKHETCKEAWEWAHAMARNGPGPVGPLSERHIKE